MGRKLGLSVVVAFVSQELKCAEAELAGAEALKDYGRACFLSGKISGLTKGSAIIASVLETCPKRGGDACGK